MAHALHPFRRTMMGWYKIKYWSLLLMGILFAASPLYKTAFSQIVMPHPRIGMCSARLGSKLFLIGGAESKAQNLHGLTSLPSLYGSSTVEAFDFSTMTWDENIAPLDTPRAYATAVVLNDSIYVMGGVDANGNVLKTVEVYDQSTKEWHYTSSMLRYRKGAASVVYGDSILVFGGSGKNGVLHTLVEAYSPASGTWSPSDSTLFGRIFHRVVKIGSYVYIFGGVGAASNIVGGPLGYVEKYIPGEGVVQIKFVWKYPREFFDIVQKDDSVFAISGYGQSSSPFIDQGYYGDIELLDFRMASENPETNAEADTEAEATSNSIMPRVGFVAQFANDGTVYLFGGLSPDHYSGQIPVDSVSEVSIPYGPTAVHE
ncbi:MAG: kelch repeat-containing protein, partial [Candidatus Kryptoniota bacterium]